MCKCERLPVCLSGGAVWNRPFSASWLSLLIAHLFNHDFRVNKRLIYPMLAIDMPTRRRMDNLPNLEKKRTHDYRIINKALADELLVSLLLTHLNAASEVRTWCVTRHDLPNTFSPPGFADAAARYVDSLNNRSFRLVVEASVRHFPGSEDFKTQLRQAWNHASELAKDDEAGEVYALVITICEIGSDDGWGEIFRDFVEEVDMQPDGPVRVVPMYAGDLVVATRKIEENLPEGALQFTPALLAGILEELLVRLIDPLAQSDLNPDWMCDLWVDMAKQEAEGEAELGLSQASPSEGASAESGADPEPG